MEEADNIILPILREIGSHIPSDITSIKQLDAEKLYAAVSAAVNLINSSANNSSDVQYPASLPPAKAIRYRICSGLALRIKELGYASELGYESFLYPNELTSRRLLQFLVNKLPQTSENQENQAENQQTSAVQHSSAGIQRRIKDSIKEFISKPYNPLIHPFKKHFASPFNTNQVNFPTEQANSEAEKVYFAQFQPILSAQAPNNTQYVANLIKFNESQLLLSAENEKNLDATSNASTQRASALSALISNAFRSAHRSVATDSILFSSLNPSNGSQNIKINSAFNRKTEFEQEKDRINVNFAKESGEAAEKGQNDAEQNKLREEEVLRLQRETQISSLQEEIDALMRESRAIELKLEQFTASSRQIDAELHALSASTAPLEDSYKVKKKTLDLLPEAQKNLAELGRLVQQSSAKLIELATEWENHRVPLIQKLRKAKEKQLERKETIGKKAELIRKMREEMKFMAQELREKDGALRSVEEEFKTLPKSINRQVYVRRIMDIMKNLDKQKEEISKILGDVRRVQKDINTVTESNKRSFSIADEIIFQHAKKNPSDFHMAKAYKLLVELRDGFAALIDTVNETGRIHNELREQIIQIDDLQQNNSAINIDRVSSDLNAIKKENKALQANIKGKQ
jgi:hypothetical protein